VDGSEHAERAAHYLAHFVETLSASETIVLYVHPVEKVPTRAPDGSEIAFDLHDAGMTVSRRVREILDQCNVRYRLDATLGDAADVIAHVAEEEQVDELVMGSRGLSTWQGLVLGSVTQKVIRQVAVPVTVVTPTQDEPSGSTGAIRRILLATDGSPHAARAVEYICNLAARGVAIEVEVLNVPAAVPQGMLSAFLNAEVLNSHYGEASTPALRGACAALASGQINFNTHVITGHVAEQIVRLARERRCSNIVMGTRGLSALGDLTLGSVAYQVVHLAPVPVTLVKSR
jgi:nucleotide-binding universal stress UspA family protein